MSDYHRRDWLFVKFEVARNVGKVWFSSCTKADQQALQRVVKTAGRIIGTSLTEISTIYSTCCLRYHQVSTGIRCLLLSVRLVNSHHNTDTDIKVLDVTSGRIGSGGLLL
ncbi:uncharacterized protein V6R79_020749 [Siganus canaliculatus]